MPPTPRAPSLAGGRLAAAALCVGVIALCGMLTGYRELTRLQQAEPAGAPLAEQAAAATAPAAERLAAQPLPSSLAFPEAKHFFDFFEPATTSCTKLLGAPLPVAGLQPAMQACLGSSPACACVIWDKAAGTAQMGSNIVPMQQQQGQQLSHSNQLIVAARRGCRQAPCAAPAAAAGSGSTQRGLEGCPAGMHEAASEPGGLICNPCPGGYCGVLPGAELLPVTVLDAPLQAALAGPPFVAAGQAGRPTTSLHGINPSVFEWRGRRMVAARATNFGNCAVPGGTAAAGSGEAAGNGAGAALQAARRRLAGDAAEDAVEEAEQKEKPPIFVNFVTLCDLGAAAEPVGKFPASACRLLPVDMAALAAQVPNMTLINEVQGVEDPRTFVHNGAPYVLVTLHLLGAETPQQRLARGRKRVWSDPGMPLHNFMAALRLNPALDAVESGVVLRCEALQNTRQKNFMPLQLASGELYLVTDVQPLTVVQPDLRTGACRIVYKEGSQAASTPRSGAVSRSALAGSSSAGGTGGSSSPAAAFNGAAAFAGVVGGGHVHGGSPFVHIGGDLYLSVVHHKRHLPYGGVYLHHLALLRATSGRFRVDWLSEAFRFPDRPGASPLALDVQFAPSLTLHGDDLLIGFGVGDCHSELVRVPAFSARLASWLHGGMGTQQDGGPALQLPQPQPQPVAYPGQQPGSLARGVRRPVSIIRWEAPVFSDTEEHWAAAAAAIGSRWAASPAINATARLVLRHLDRPDAGWGTPRDVGGLPVVDSNQENGVIPDVAISHAGADGLTRAVARAWMPWLPAVGLSLDNTTAALLRRHAAKVLVPSSFHSTSLVHALGLRPNQVAVLPQQPQAGDSNLCPPHFVRSGGSKPDRETLAHVLGQQAGALRSFVFLHQAPAAWQYGAELLLEAYAAGWSAADDVSLVLSLLPPADADEEAPGSSWAVYLDGLQQRVDSLSRKPGAPHVVLVTRLPRLGRWEERLLQAADAAVLPYLGGSAGRELLLAASCGKAVVTTAGGPAADVLPGNGSAWLVPAQPMRCRPAATPAGEGQAARPARLPLGCLQVRAADLAAGMQKAWKDVAGRRQRGVAAREAAQHWVKDTAGWDSLAAQLWRHVQGLLPAPASQVA